VAAHKATPQADRLKYDRLVLFVGSARLQLFQGQNVYQLFNSPNVIRNPRFHRRRYTKSLVNPAIVCY
jgi:hypothetical protein